MSQNSGPLMMGLDLGTTGAKAGLVDLSGRVLATATGAYPTLVPKPGWAEQDPEAWWDSAALAIRQVLLSSAADPRDIVSIGVSGQMHGSVFLDGSLEVVRPCILWCDQRTTAQSERIRDLVGEEALSDTVGNPALEGFTAPKILWLRDEEPGAYALVRHVLLPKDYINLKLTGALSTDVSDASGTLLFDVRKRTWSGEVLDLLDIERGWLPEIYEACAGIGTVCEEASEATGLSKATTVAAGGADNACGAIGMGVVEEGQVAVSIGSSGTVLAPSGHPAVDPRMRLHCFCHAVPDTWYLMGVMLSAGLSLRWFRDEMGEPESSEARRLGIDAYELLDETAAESPPGCGGLIFLPYMSGERTPHADPYARGVLFGLDLAKTRSHVVRAIMEGVCFGLKDSISLMRELGVPIESVVGGGGGSRSGLWRGMLADVFELPLSAAGQPDSAMLGAAVLGGVAAGAFPSVRDACRATVANGPAVEPDPSNSVAYRNAYARYRSLYPALRAIFRSA